MLTFFCTVHAHATGPSIEATNLLFPVVHIGMDHTGAVAPLASFSFVFKVCSSSLCLDCSFISQVCSSIGLLGFSCIHPIQISSSLSNRIERTCRNRPGSNPRCTRQTHVGQAQAHQARRERSFSASILLQILAGMLVGEPRGRRGRTKPDECKSTRWRTSPLPTVQCLQRPSRFLRLDCWPCESPSTFDCSTSRPR